MTTQIAVGQWLDAWIVEEALGEGAFAKVFRGKHSAHQHTAALKVPTDPRYVDRLRIDPRALQLEHPHIVRAQELHLEHEPPFVVLDLVEGGTLREVMLLEHVSLERVSRIVGQLAAALDHAHDRGVLHLDLKPENVLVDTDGDVHLTDFGVVPPGANEVLAQSLLLSAELGLVGTRDYAAPELRAPSGTLDRRADVYGLGVVAFELLTGRLPIGLDRPTELKPDLPAAVDEVLAGALARDPARRPLSAGAFATSLRAALAVAPEEPQAAAPRHNLAWLAGLAGGLILAVLAAVALSSPAETAQASALRDLWAAVPPGAPVTLLPVRSVSPSAKPAARAVRAVLDRALLRDDHPVYHPETDDPEFAAPALYDAARRGSLIERAGSRWAVQATALPGSADTDDAFCALLDLETLTLVAARAPRSEEARHLGEKLARELSEQAPGSVLVRAAVDAEHGVSNYTTSRFDAELRCALVAALPPSHPVLAEFGRPPDAHDPPGPGAQAPAYRVDVELDAERGVAHATTTLTQGGRSLDVQEVVWSPVDGYDPTAGAAALTRDPARLAQLEHTVDAALASALERAAASLQAGDAAAAIEILSASRARGAAYAERVAPLVALADARRAAKDLDGCLRDYREALTHDPSRADLRARYATVCLEEARALYAEGKGRWYQNDDEDILARALELLELTERLELEPDLRAELDALTADVRREL